MKLLCCGVVLISTAFCLTQGAASLQTLIANYNAQRAALTATYESQVKGPRERYLASLGAAQKTAMAATRTTDLAAISSEMEAVGIGSLPDAAPPDLPRNLMQDRRSLVNAFASASRSLVTKQRDLALSYQRNLASLETAARKAKDQALLDSIAGEKQRAIAEIEGAGGGQKNKNIVENGDFSKALEGGAPAGWTKAYSWKNVTDAMVVSEGRDKFLRFRRLQSIMQSDLMPDKALPVPTRARYAQVTFRIRVEGLVKGKEYDPWPCVRLAAKDARDENLAKEDTVVKEDTGWKRMSARVALPDGTKHLRVVIGPFGAAGIVDFDDVEVEFK